MARLPETINIPWKPDDIKSEKKEDLEYFLKTLVRKLGSMYTDIANIVNINAIDFVAQDATPTCRTGRLMVWKDTDAGVGNPTHYLIYKDPNGNTVTFASEEVA